MQKAIEVHEVTKVFDLSIEKQISLKSAILSFRRRKTPNKLVALKNINLTINQGETVAVIGKNGSGKSTLLLIIGRVYKPTSGYVSVNGRMSTMLHLGAGFHPELTGRENIFL